MFKSNLGLTNLDMIQSTYTLKNLPTIRMRNTIRQNTYEWVIGFVGYSYSHSISHTIMPIIKNSKPSHMFDTNKNVVLNYATFTLNWLFLPMKGWNSCIYLKSHQSIICLQSLTKWHTLLICKSRTLKGTVQLFKWFLCRFVKTSSFWTQK